MSETGLIFREARIDEWDAAISLSWEVFEKFEAQEYGEEGTSNFRDFIYDDVLREMFIKGEYKVFVACKDKEIIGVISLRDMTHISLLFVREDYHKQGVGRNLVGLVQEHASRVLGMELITVNSSPYAVGFYHRLGFIDTGLQTTTDGITYTPMEAYI